MSQPSPLTPQNPDAPPAPDFLETLIVPRSRDIGDFEVRRALPATQRQMVGPFIFFDQFGPVEFLCGKSMDVRPHPHIGLATVTYVYEGGIFHQDSLGNEMEIKPGAVNWMIAGKGITHSERTPKARRKDGERLSGIQTWVALPERHEDTDPGFEHVAKTDLPFLEEGGKQVRLILGSLYGERAPVRTFSDMFYADAVLEKGAKLPLPSGHEDRGIYVFSGAIEIAGDRFEAGQMAVFRPGDEITLTALEPARLILLGGETLEGPRHIWWNLVSSSRDKLEEAKQEWAKPDHGRFQLPPHDKDEFIPLPDK